MEKLMLRERVALKLGFVEDPMFPHVYVKTLGLLVMVYAPGRPWKELKSFRQEWLGRVV